MVRRYSMRTGSVLTRTPQGAQKGGVGDRLAQVGIRAEVKGQFLVVGRAVDGRVADVRDFAPAFVLADFPAEPVAAQVGHEQVSNDGARVVVLNFSRLAYKDSSGVKVLVRLLTHAKAAGQRLFAG